jgi:hypothetical protein
MALALLAGPVAAQEVERIAGDDVAIYNLAGEVEIVRGSGSDVVVRITRGGTDASQLAVVTGDINGRGTLRIVYPGDEIVYPEMGRGSSSSLRVRENGTFSDGMGRGGEQVRVRGSGSGLEAWADLRVEVPEGQAISVYQAVGTAEATGVIGDLSIDTGSGEVTATDISGALDVDTGSGRVSVQGLRGRLGVDTGSGRVDVADVVGSVVEIDTGSGGVTAAGIQAERVGVDTGSGSVELEGVTSAEVRVDTGSGSVEIELLRDVELLEVDTGSGSVTVRAPSNLGAEIDLDTGGGGIDVDFPVEVQSVRRDMMRGRIGDGRGEIEIDTGSGSIRLIQNRN